MIPSAEGGFIVDEWRGTGLLVTSTAKKCELVTGGNNICGKNAQLIHLLIQISAVIGGGVSMGFDELADGRNVVADSRNADILGTEVFQNVSVRRMDSASEGRVRKEAKGHKKIRRNKEDRKYGEDERGNGYSFDEGQI
jgi:hypothetical protein